MGEKDGNEKSGVSIVLKLEMHCEGCMTKVLKTVRSIPGVDGATADWEANKLTVRATVDPSKLREELQKRTKKKVELISPQAKKENNNKAEKKPDEKKSKEPPETTAVLKLQLHCMGCIVKIHKITSKFKGVDKVTIDKEKDLITLTGKMDAKALVEILSEKMKRPVEIVPPKKDKENGEGKGGDGGGGEKKKGGGDGAEGNKLEYIGLPLYPPVPAHVPVYGPGYAYPYAPDYPFFGNPHPPQVFSDENPNACSIM